MTDMVALTHFLSIIAVGVILVWAYHRGLRASMQPKPSLSFPDNYRGTLSNEARETLDQLGVGFFWWDGGDTIIWDRNSARMYGVNVDEMEGETFVGEYARWARAVEDPEDLARETAKLAEAMGSGTLYHSQIRYRVGSESFIAFHIGGPDPKRPDKPCIRGITVRLPSPIVTAHTVVADEILGRIRRMNQRLETVLQKEAAIHGGQR